MVIVMMMLLLIAYGRYLQNPVAASAARSLGRLVLSSGSPDGVGLFKGTQCKKGRLFIFAQAFVLIPAQQHHFMFLILLQEGERESRC